MHSNRYRLLGYAVWHGGRWYLRRRLPSRRKLVLGASGALLASAGALALAKRISG
ncbi:MAG TPA: hypothetical protein VGY13_05155 [Solirubrobacteraceae bacterium]|jgi:hypothetical protein|nr:hypothetical protein [Solirubrobacteraceae bacterium]